VNGPERCCELSALEFDHRCSGPHRYLNIAHRIQKIIPQLNLPNANSEGSFALSHAVDVGDVGFVLRIDRRGPGPS
jgi:hypothetical protein